MYDERKRQGLLVNSQKKKKKKLANDKKRNRIGEKHSCDSAQTDCDMACNSTADRGILTKRKRQKIGQS